MLLKPITHRGAGVGQGQSVVPYNMAGVGEGVVVPYNPQGGGVGQGQGDVVPYNPQGAGVGQGIVGLIYYMV